MACAIEAIDSGQDCGLIEGGILYSYATKLENITAVTKDANDQITAITMTGTGLWEKWEYDVDNTALYEQPGSRNVNRITYAQRAFLKFKGITNAYRLAAQKASECCNVVVIHRLSTGAAIVQGLENSTVTGGFTKTRVLETRVVPTLTTDTSQNEPRLELSVEGTANSLSLFTTLTDAAIEAL